MAWNDILSQDLAKRMLQTHLASGQVAGAYLLTGPDGVGKKRLAMEMAKALICESNGSRPCETCTHCLQVSRSTHPDVHVITGSGASALIKIEQIRHMLSRVALRPFRASCQVVVIDGVERLTEEAANSLLKTLEEPSKTTRFLLTTSRLAQCVSTIVSRCQLVRCHALSVTAVTKLLVDTQHIPAPMAEVAARVSGGSVSRAMQLAEQWASYEQVIGRCTSTRPMAWLEQPLPETRQDVLQLLDGLLGWLRDLSMVAAGDAGSATHAEHITILQQQAGAVDLDRCLETAFQLMELRESIEQFVNPRLVATLARERWLNLYSSQSIVHSRWRSQHDLLGYGPQTMVYG